MKLIFIYGPPGVGKLTTARAVSALTGVRLVDNHLSFNLVRAVFDFPSRPFLELLERVRLATFEAAAREGVPALIFTFVYAAGHDDAFVKTIMDAVERDGGEVRFVRLHCEAAVNEERVVAEERRELGKICSAESLRRAHDRYELGAPVPFRPSLEIENSTLGPEEAARLVAAHCALPMR